MSNETTIKDQAKGINWHTAIFIALFHVGALAALLMFSSKALVSAIVLWWVALLTFGEGWHNNHHAYPTSARHGLAWYEIDLNWWGIRVMRFLRLAKAVRLVRETNHADA